MSKLKRSKRSVEARENSVQFREIPLVIDGGARRAINGKGVSGLDMGHSMDGLPGSRTSGSIAQLGERNAGSVEVRGSSPRGSIGVNGRW